MYIRVLSEPSYDATDEEESAQLNAPEALKSKVPAGQKFTYRVISETWHSAESVLETIFLVQYLKNTVKNTN